MAQLEATKDLVERCFASNLQEQFDFVNYAGEIISVLAFGNVEGFPSNQQLYSVTHRKFAEQLILCSTGVYCVETVSKLSDSTWHKAEPTENDSFITGEQGLVFTQWSECVAHVLAHVCASVAHEPQV